MMHLLPFGAYSVFAWWVIFRDGAEVLEGWGAFAFLGLFAATLTPAELKFYVGISWVASLVVTLFLYFSSGGA